MKIVDANIVIDMGNSETRVLVQSGIGRSGLIKQQLTTVSNIFSQISPDYEVPENYSEEDTVVFETADGEFYANGLLVEREFSMSALRPTALDPKPTSKVTMLTIQRAFLEGYRLLSNMYRCSLKSLDVTWNVTFLLPPNDIATGAKTLYGRIKGLEEINFKLPNFSTKLKINSVKAYPEGFAAYIGTVMRRGRIISDTHKHLLSSKTLVVDIGAGTTDFFVIEGMETIDSTRLTLPYGGNNIIARVKQALLSKNIQLPNKEIEKGVIEGKIKDGRNVINLAKSLAIFKTEVANTLIDGLTSYLEGNGYPVRSIENLLVVGGGSLASQVEGVESLSTYLVDRLKDFAPNIELVTFQENFDEDGNQEVETNPRLLNVLGAGVLAEKG
jgi:hypothetical protein